MNARLACLLCAALVACGDTGRERVEIAASARGTARASLTVGGAVFTLSRAEIGFGPVYFCATEGADVELCEIALAELLESVTLDGLSEERVPIGSLDATTGSVRSALYDYGISWLLTQPRPRASEGAPGGHSAILEGEVQSEQGTLRFVAELDVEPRVPGDAAVNAQRTSFEIRARGHRLTVIADPYRWLERIDVERLFALDEDGDGVVELSPGDQAYEAIVLGMTSRAPLQFEWTR